MIMPRNIITMHMGIVMYVHNRVDTIMHGHKRAWSQTCLGTIVSCHKHAWTQTRPGTNVS